MMGWFMVMVVEITHKALPPKLERGEDRSPL